MAENVPVDKGSKEATCTALAGDFKFDDKIRSLFLGGPMESLEDVRCHFADEKEIDAFGAAEETLRESEQRSQMPEWGTHGQKSGRMACARKAVIQFHQ